MVVSLPGVPHVWAEEGLDRSWSISAGRGEPNRRADVGWSSGLLHGGRKAELSHRVPGVNHGRASDEQDVVYARPDGQLRADIGLCCSELLERAASSLAHLT